MQPEEEIDKEIEEAVADEREACAQLVENYAKAPAWITSEAAAGIAAAIRRRGEE